MGVAVCKSPILHLLHVVTKTVYLQRAGVELPQQGVVEGHASSPLLLLPVFLLRMDGRSPSRGCCTVALVVPPSSWSQCDGSCLDISACGSWGGQCEPQMRLKLCLVWAGVICSRSKWSMWADSLLFFPVITSWAVKPQVIHTRWLLGLKDKKAIELGVHDFSTLCIACAHLICRPEALSERDRKAVFICHQFYGVEIPCI